MPGSRTGYASYSSGISPNNEIPVGGLERHALAALDFVGLAARAGGRVGSLSYGHQRLVEIARALAGSPKLLFLDEPGAGLNHVAERCGPVVAYGLVGVASAPTLMMANLFGSAPNDCTRTERNFRSSCGSSDGSDSR